MNYELAIELKEVGWDQHLGGMRWLTEDGHHYCGGNEQHAKEPLLSELIEECGERFANLCQVHEEGERWDKWSARSTDDSGAITEYAPTIEEAVAKLWLALNKQNAK